MYGMLCALTAAGMWLALATFLELPVSTTHTTVAGIVGFSLVAAGGDAVVWTTPAGNGSPFPGGFVAIIIAWFVTPVMAAALAALLFQFTKLFVLYAKNPFRRALALLPIYTAVTIWVVTFFIIQKGVNNWIKAKSYGSCPPGSSTSKPPTCAADGSDCSYTGCLIGDGTNAWISAVAAGTVTLASVAALKWIARLVERDEAALDAADARRADARRALVDSAAERADGLAGSSIAGDSDDAAPGGRGHTPAVLGDLRRSRVWRALAHGSSVDIHGIVDADAKVGAMHADAETFDRKSELTFKYLQIVTACANSFAHGANDVANAIGPLAAIYAIWECACVSSKSDVPIWMFVIGGAGLVVGLATYGYNIMRALGVKVTKITNSRGYCAELASAIVVIFSSRYGFPVSTTQTITGAIAGIGALEAATALIKKQPRPGGRMNWLLLLKFFGGWVATLAVAGATSAAFMAQGIYAPNKQCSEAAAAA